MKRLARLRVPLSALIVLSALSFSQVHSSKADATPASQPSALIAIRDEAFAPATITVKAGTTVSWVNKDDDPHTVTSDGPAFDSKGMDLDSKFSHTFAKPGTYAYHCSVHPFMRGTVIVKGDH